jgi:hypothetical protein
MFAQHRRLPLEPDQRKILSKQNTLKKYDPDYQPSDPMQGSDEEDEEENDEDDAAEDQDIDEQTIAKKASQLYVPAKTSKKGNNSLDELKQRLQVNYALMCY